MSKVIKCCQVQEEKERFVLHPDLGYTEKRQSLTKEVDEIISLARREAEEIKHKAFQEGKEKGYEEGFAQGIIEGKKEGFSRTEETYREALSIVRQTEKYREEKLTQMEPEVVRLAVAIAEKIISSELTLDDQAIMHITSSALKLLIAPRFINIYVHPRDGEALIKQKKLLGEELSEIVPIKIIKNGELAPGSCTIETDKGFVDASVGTQIRELKKVLEIA